MFDITQFSTAISVAAQVHLGQTRKGKDTPYITHPLAVAVIVASVSDDSDLITAAILHDTIEDCQPYGCVSYDSIALQFGLRVADLVNSVTEQDKSLPWDERKQIALEHIAEMSHDQLLLKSADVLHNLADLNIDLEVIGESIFETFNGSREKTIARYGLVITKLEKHWTENPLLPELQVQHQKLLSLTTRA